VGVEVVSKSLRRMYRSTLVFIFLNMGKHASLPHHLYVNVKNEFLGPRMPPGVTSGLWHGVFARMGQVITCHVILESGAHWSGLPLHALSVTDDFHLGPRDLMPWFAMGERLEAWDAGYLEGLAVWARAPLDGAGRHTGIVLDWSDGFSRYPQEHKPLSLLALDSGQFALLPNNHFTVTDPHFTRDAARGNMHLYRRGEEVWWEGSATPCVTPTDE
jgi:hypothetical protein